MEFNKSIERTNNPRCFKLAYLVTFDSTATRIQGRFNSKREAERATLEDCKKQMPTK